MSGSKVPHAPLDSAEYRWPITVERRVVTRDPAGGQVTTFVKVLSAHASLESLSGRELLQAQALRSPVTHRLRMRQPRTNPPMKLTAAMRVVCRGSYYNISAVIDRAGKQREWEIMAEETKQPT